MPRSDYSEDQMLQAGTAEYFIDELKWDRSVFAYDQEDFGPDSLLGRNDKSETILFRELRKALKQLNPKAPEVAVEESMRLIAADDLAKNLVQLNEEKYKMIREGVTVEAPNENGQLQKYTLSVIDFNQPDNNDFLMVRELWVEGQHPRRTDLVGFVNGLPLLFIELKRYDKGVKLAYDKNLTDYKRDIRQLFFCNSLVVLSNGHDAVFGSITSPWEHFYRWRRLKENDPMPVKEAPLLQLLLKGMCSKTSLLDITENFLLFDRTEGKTAKIIARNHQYLGVNRVIEKLKGNDDEVKKGRLGVFWHTQGSGKSYAMVFLAQKILSTVSGKYSFLIVTDRIDLDDQVAKTFAYTGAIEDGRKARIPDSASVEKRLSMDMRIQFCIVHKFRRYVKKPYTKRDDVIVFSDEAHRTQYGKYAWNMRKALPNAKFLGFTGTPLIDSAEKQLTRDVFGDYISIYDFQLAVDDDSTVPLYYLNRGEKLKVDDPDIQRRLEERIEEARNAGEIDEDQEEKIYRKLAQEYPVVTSDTRLKKVAEDLVWHYSLRWTTGKAILVCWDKLTCGRMYTFIEKAWKQQIKKLEQSRDDEIDRLVSKGKKPNGHIERLNKRITWMKETEICVVISGAESRELAKEYKKYNLDLDMHATKLRKRELDIEFKRAEHPFRLVIVCAMWMTGFDVKSLSTMYIDKSMQGHNLMQAITRVNRIYKDKKNGLIVDYNGVIKSLRKALATFTKIELPQGSQNDKKYDPLNDDKAALVNYGESVNKAKEYLKSLGFNLVLLINKEKLEKLEPLACAVGCVKENDETKATFNVLVEDMQGKYKGLFPHSGLSKHDIEHSALEAIYNKVNEGKVISDISDMMKELYDVVDTSVDFESDPNTQTGKQYNLSKIDFSRLQQEFSKAKRQQKTFDIKEKIENRISIMLRENPSRINLYEKYQQIVRDYNRDKDEAEISRIFDKLMALDNELDAEQRRFVREGFVNEQQLAIYDLLAKENIKPSDIKKIKAISKELLTILEKRKLLSERWRERAASQAQVETTILNYLWEEIPGSVYKDKEIKDLSMRVFKYVMNPNKEVTH